MDDLDTAAFLHWKVLECDPGDCSSLRQIVAFKLWVANYEEVIALLHDSIYCTPRTLIDTTLEVALLEKLEDSVKAKVLLTDLILKTMLLNDESVKAKHEAWRLDYLFLLRKARERYNLDISDRLFELIVSTIPAGDTVFLELTLETIDSAILQNH